MKHLSYLLLFLVCSNHLFAQKNNAFSSQEISLNGFRNPSIGVEYRYHHASVHAGYYVTNFTQGLTTEFLKAGFTYWFLAVDKKPIPSSFYAGASYLRGTSRDYKNLDAVGVEAGFRYMIWKGLNVRIGAIALAASGKDLKINPTPGISYSFHF